MKNEEHLVSVIMPVYNGGRYLAEAVESILQQNYRPLEIVVVDDGSTDNTAQIAGILQDRVHYLYQPNRGPSSARNRGLMTAKGDVIGFLDVDDLWSENRLKLQLEHFAKVPSLEVVMGHTQRMQLICLENGIAGFREWSEPVIAMHLGSAFFRRTVFQKVGLFDESLDYCEDWDWFMRAKEMHVPMVVHKEVTYYYRRHDQNITNDTERTLNHALKVLKQSLDRRRQQGNGRVKQLPRLSDLTAGSPRISDKETDRMGRNESED